MNEQPLYELQMASILEQLPVPDMEDAIWMRIKDQLDADMPTNGHNSPPPPPIRPRTTGRGKLGFLGLIVATLVLIYFIAPKKQKQILPATPQQTQTDTTPVMILPPKGPPGKEKPAIKTTTRPQQQKDTAVFVPSQQMIQPPVQPDTAVFIPPLPPPALRAQPEPLLKRDTVPAKKKPRGVKGISDSDYKLVPKTQP